ADRLSSRPNSPSKFDPLRPKNSKSRPIGSRSISIDFADSQNQVVQQTYFTGLGSAPRPVPVEMADAMLPRGQLALGYRFQLKICHFIAHPGAVGQSVTHLIRALPGTI